MCSEMLFKSVCIHLRAFPPFLQRETILGLFITERICLTLSVPDVISGRGDVGLITLVDVYFAKITLRV